MAAKITLQETKDGLFSALQRKNSLQHYLRIAYSFLQSEIALCDTSFCLLSAWPEFDDPENIEESNGKNYLKFSTTQNMEEKHLLERIYQSHIPFVVEDVKFSHEIVFQSIRINEAVVAYLFIHGSDHGYSDEELDLIQYLSQILSVEMQKNDSFEVQNGLKYGYFLSELLEGHLDSEVFIEQRLQQLKRKPQPYYYILCFEFMDVRSAHSSASYYYEQLLTIFPRCLIAVVKGVLCLLLPRENSEVFSEREKAICQNFLQMNRMRVGVSYRFSCLVSAPQYFAQAKAALQGGDPSQMICLYEDRYMGHIFACCNDKNMLEAQIHPGIQVLLAANQEKKTEYMKTLRCYLDCNRNAQLAAQALHIHKSTFFYRLSKIAELLHVDWADSQRLFAYEYSFRIYDFLNNQY